MRFPPPARFSGFAQYSSALPILFAVFFFFFFLLSIPFLQTPPVVRWCHHPVNRSFSIVFSTSSFALATGSPHRTYLYCCTGLIPLATSLLPSKPGIIVSSHASDPLSMPSHPLINPRVLFRFQRLESRLCLKTNLEWTDSPPTFSEPPLFRPKERTDPSKRAVSFLFFPIALVHFLLLPTPP